MKRFLQPAALATLFVFGMLPAAQLACQWVCELAAAGQASHAAHHHAAAAAPDSKRDGDVAQVIANESGCDHVNAVVATLSSNKVIGAPASTPVGRAVIAFEESSACISLPAPSPAGGPPGLISLRI